MTTKPLITLLCLLLSAASYAQSGPGIKFHYGPGGFRIKREFLFTTPYFKQGTTDDGSTADTVIVSRQDSKNPLEKSNEIFVKAYPNPVSDALYIEHLFWEKESTATIRVQDILGKYILEKRTTLAKDFVSLGHVAPGTYSVSYFVNGTLLTSWKIVKL